VKLATARTLTILYFIGYAVAVTWPGIVPFNRVRPTVLGLPFVMVWMALWIVGALFVLWGLDRVEARHRRGEG
jgi:hypothetical protein